MPVPFVVRAGVLTALVLLAAGRPAGAQPPPPPPPAPQIGPPRDPGRRPPPEPVGTAVIRGRVVTSDTGMPVRRASVSLSMMPPSAPPGTTTGGVVGGIVGGLPATTRVTTQTTMVNGTPTTFTSAVSANFVRPKSATTDAQGNFEFRDLPAGSYRLTASPGQYSAAYLGIAYGAKKPAGPGIFDAGVPIVLANGQAFEKATLALPRGSVITGRVTDENGDALARVQVYTINFPQGSARGQRNGMSTTTDDLGQFRLYGLAAGEFSVVAEAQRQTFVQPNAPPESEEDKIGFMTTYYPGTADETAAQRVQTRAGTETPGIEIRMVSGRLFRISGMVTDSQGRPLRANGQVMRRTPGFTSFSSYGFSTDEQGRFQMRNVAPGNYRLTVRQNPQGPRNPDGSPPEPGEFANMPLTLSGDLEDLLVITTPGVTITGQVVFENGPPQPGANQQPVPMRVNAMFADPEGGMGMMPSPQPAVVTPDLTFTMKGMQGEFLLRASAPGQFLKAVMVGGEDITDTPREFKPSDKVTVILTSRPSTLEGNVTDAKGQPTTDAGIIVFSEDKGSWRQNSVRTRRGGTDQTGHYRITGLLPGRYYILAAPRERLNVPSPDAAFFEQLAKEATAFVLGEDEQRQVDVKMSAAAGG